MTVQSDDSNSDIPKSEISDEKLEQLSGFLDGELTQQEAQKVTLLIEKDAEYKKLYEELSAMRNEIQSLSLQEQELEHLDKIFEEPTVKLSRVVGFSLLVISILLIIGFTLLKIFTNPTIDLIEKILVGALGGGSLLLFFSVLRQRLMSSKKDKYKGVKI